MSENIRRTTILEGREALTILRLDSSLTASLEVRYCIGHFSDTLDSKST